MTNHLDPKRRSEDRKRDDEKGDGLDTHVLAIEEADEIIRAEHEFTCAPERLSVADVQARGVSSCSDQV